MTNTSNDQLIKQIREILTDPISLYSKWYWTIEDHVLLRHSSDKRAWFAVREVAGLDKSGMKQITKELKKLGLILHSWSFFKRVLNVYIEANNK